MTTSSRGWDATLLGSDVPSLIPPIVELDFTNVRQQREKARRFEPRKPTIEPLNPSRDHVWERCTASGKTFEESLIESGVISSQALAESYSRQYLLPLFDPPADQPPPIDVHVSRLLPGRICLDAMIAPLADDGTTLDVAIVSPEALRARDEILRLSGRQMRPFFATLEVVETILAMLYAEDQRDSQVLRDRQSIEVETAATDPMVDSPDSVNLRERANHYVQFLLEEAVERRASDIHIDPLGDRWRVRMRIAGSLVPVAPPDAEHHRHVAEALKRLANLDPQESTKDQEGRFRLNHGRRKVSIDLLTGPTVAGETFVLKIRGRQTSAKSLHELGLDSDQLSRFTEALEGPSGIVIIAGKNGSGKQTTLYACLQFLNSAHHHLCSVEEAIRLPLPGVNQFPAKPEHGLAFNEAVRSVLRRDPDVLMLSDLRDPDTASLCFRAANEGRRILAAVNANTAREAITSLARLGIPARAISKHVKLVVAQRMVRRLCTNCRVEKSYDLESLKRLGVDPAIAKSSTANQLLKGFETKGCKECRGSGFRGGIVLFERMATASELIKEIRARSLGSKKAHTSASNSASPKALTHLNLRHVNEGIISLHDLLGDENT